MRLPFPASLLLCLALAPGSWADVSLRYSYDIQPGPAVPPQAAESMKAQLQKTLQPGTVLRLKGNRAYSSSMGITSITDFDGAMVTLLDAKQSRYGTAQKDAYIAAMAARQEAQMKQIPEQTRATLDRMTIDVSPEVNTGRTLSIHGIETEERQITLNMAWPGNTGSLGRVLISFWIPAEEALARHPILREWHAFTQRAYQGTDPNAAVQKMFGQTPGMGSAAKLMGVFKNHPVLLQVKTSMFLPALPGMPPPPAGSADTPLMDMTMKLEEISDAEVPDSTFRTPREYTAVTIEEALAGIYAQMMPPRPPAAAPKPAPMR